MRPKLTWRICRWSEGSLVEPVSDSFRQCYGHAAADIVELVRDMMRDHRDQPSMQDRKATLHRLAEAPTEADRSRLDTHTDALMLKHSWRMYRVHNIEALRPEQVAACAKAALADIPTTNGRPKTDALAIMLVRDLLAQLPPRTPPRERDGLLQAAVEACSLGTSVRTIKALRSVIGKSRVQIERKVPPPDSQWQGLVQVLLANDSKAKKNRGRRAG